MLNRFQFDEVLKDTRAMNYQFPVEMDTTSSTLRLRFFLTISAVITQLHDHQPKLAQHTTERAIHTFSHIYMLSLRRADVDTRSSQPYLALLSLLKQTLSHSLSIKQLTGIVKVLAKEHSNSVQNWFDILVFQKSLAFCIKDPHQRSVELPHCSFHVQNMPKETLHERSNQFRGYFNLLKQQGNDHALIRVGYAWSKLLLMEGAEQEGIGVLKEVESLCERMNDEDSLEMHQKCERRLIELTASPPNSCCLSVHEIWCDILMRELPSELSPAKCEAMLAQLIEAFRGVSEIASITHIHFVYILFELLTHSSLSFNTQFSIPVLTPLFPVLIHSLPSFHSPSIRSLLALIPSNKELAAKFMIPLLSRQELLDPALVAALRRQTPKLLIEAETLSRELGTILYSKYMSVISLLDRMNRGDLWNEQSRDDVQEIIQGPQLITLDEELTRELSLRLPSNWTFSDVF